MTGPLCSFFWIIGRWLHKFRTGKKLVKLPAWIVKSLIKHHPLAKEILKVDGVWKRESQLYRRVWPLITQLHIMA